MSLGRAAGDIIALQDDLSRGRRAIVPGGASRAIGHKGRCING